MKKKNRLAITSIRGKLFLLILVTVLLLTAAFFLVTGYQNSMLTELTEETGKKQQASLTETTYSVMTQTVRRDLLRATELESMAVNEIFSDAEAQLTVLAGQASRIYAEPESYPPDSWQSPDPSLDGTLAAQVLFADGTDPSDPEVRAAVDLAANLSDLMLSIADTFNTDNLYIGLPEGVFLMVNRTSANWIEEDGSFTSYDPRSRFWYRQAAEAGTLVFSDVETDANTGKLSLVCAVPVYDPSGELRAVIGVDLLLDSMLESMQGSEQNGNRHLVVNRDGHLIVSSLEDPAFRATVSEEAIDLRDSENTELATFVRKAMDGKTEARPVHLKSGTYYMAGCPVETVGWTLISVFSEEDVLYPTTILRKNYEEIQEEAAGSYRDKNNRSKATIIIMIAALFLLMSAIALFLGGRIVNPLKTMTRRISDLSEDNLNFEMEDTYRTGDEIEILAESFSELASQTTEYIDEVRTATAEKERIRSELNMAAAIQSSMLPHDFPPFPDRKEFDLYASMDPAKEVGGDFYDFFLIDDDHLCMIMADVSGKGIPAALFMMVSKVILQSCAMLGRSAEEILSKTNEGICSNNQAEMFVTVWLGILEISTGKLTAANAGHEYPVLKRAGGDYEIFKDRHGFVIGGMAEAKFRQYELQLGPGDKLFLYTDGAPEATDADQQLFGMDRMLDALNSVKDADPAATLEGVRKAIDGFVKDAEQFDDLTMLCMEYKGPEASA